MTAYVNHEMAVPLAAGKRPLVDADFWRQYQSATQSGTKPAVLDLGCAGNLFPVGQMLALGRRILDAGELSVNVDGELVQETALPETPDFTNTGGFESYMARVCAAFAARSVTFTRDYCLRYDAAFAAQVRSFVDGYVETVGIPMPGINAVFIAGHYKETWIGLHNDFCNTFLVPIHGRKQVMFWPPDYFSGRDELTVQSSFNGLCFGHTDVTPYAADAVSLTVVPGQALFIPEGWWHYNNLDRPETTLALSIGVFSNGTVADSAQGAIAAALNLPIGCERTDTWTRPRAGVLSGLEELPVPEQLQRLLASIEQTMRIQVLKMASSNGVIGAPFTAIRPRFGLQGSTVVCGRRDSPVFLVPIGGGAGLLFAQGQMAKVPSALALTRLVSRIAEGQPFVVGEEEAEENIAWLEWLYERGALELD